MNYARPELGERLAADYVLGMMPPRARRRFERAMSGNATLAAVVGAWTDRLAPLDTLTLDAMPPARIWRTIDRRIGPGAPRTAPSPRVPRSFWRSFRRGLAAAAIAACAAVALYVAVNPTPVATTVEALAAWTGLPAWIGTAHKRVPDIGLSTMRLGVSERERPRWLHAALLLANDAAPLTKLQKP